MDPMQFTRRIRLVGTVVMLLAGAACALLLAGSGWDRATAGLAALAVAAVCLGGLFAYARTRVVACRRCGGRMRISRGYPTIAFRCTACGEQVDTRIASD